MIDESQDISVPQLRVPRRAPCGEEDGLFFAGDLGPAHLPDALLVALARRRRAWPVEHAAHQLPHLAPDPPPGDLLLPPEMSDVDENTEVRRGTVSAFNRPRANRRCSSTRSRRRR